MSVQTEDKTEENKFEDILSSIRKIIDNNKERVSKDDRNIQEKEQDILELTNIVDFTAPSTECHNTSTLISNKTKDTIEQEIQKLIKTCTNAEIHKKQTDILDSKVSQMMQPMIKVWLDNNLPKIVKQIVLEEIKKVMQKI